MTRLVLSVLAVTIAGVATAQTFFREDFNTLSPEWVFSPPMEDESGFLTYEISQGNFIATGVNQGNPAFFGGGGRFKRFFLPGGQYVNEVTEQLRLRARFTLPRGDAIRGISFSLRNVDQWGFDNYGSITYSIQRLNTGQYASRLYQYRPEGTTLSTYWTFDPAPYYELEFFYQGNDLVATLNGMEVNRTSSIPARFNQVTFGMGGPYGTTSVGPRIDYIEVVPEPATLIGFSAAAGILLRKRKKSDSSTAQSFRG